MSFSSATFNSLHFIAGLLYGCCVNYHESLRAELAVLLDKLADEVSIVDCALAELVVMKLRGEAGQAASDAWVASRKLVTTVRAFRDLLG